MDWFLYASGHLIRFLESPRFAARLGVEVKKINSFATAWGESEPKSGTHQNLIGRSCLRALEGMSRRLTAGFESHCNKRQSMLLSIGVPINRISSNQFRKPQPDGELPRVVPGICECSTRERPLVLQFPLSLASKDHLFREGTLQTGQNTGRLSAGLGKR